MKRYLSLTALLVALAVLAAGCGSSSKSSKSGSSGSKSSGVGTIDKSTESSGVYTNGKVKKGGVYRVGWESSFGFTDAFDPTGEYLGNAWGIYQNLLLRSLIGYKHVGGTTGNDAVGDLATSVPKPTNGGKTYTYKIRSGVKFGPPVNRAVTSKDVAYAMERLANPKDGGQYPFYYTVIQGWDAVAAGKAKTISGIQTPDDSTIVFNLTKPAGDFNLRMSMPATAPIPPEVGKCFSGAKANQYGRHVVSSGPYMIAGSDKASIASCAGLKPFSGYNGTTNMTLVRNPNYDQSTDSTRKNYPDSFQYIINSNADDIYNKVQSGELDDEISSPQPKTIREYSTNSSISARLRPNVGDRTNYFTMNLTQPPFDDVHVRKAMNWVMDKNSLQKAWGGPIVASIATHVVPPILFGGGLSNYDPYKTPNNAGDAKKAMAEMKKSKYDTNHDGKCDASACKNVLMISDVRSVDTRMIPIVQDSASKIGVTFKVRSVNGAYPVIQTPNKNIPIATRTSWGKDYADPSTFFTALFLSTSIIAQGNTNYSLVGVTPAIAKKVGATGNLNNVPSVDADINHCNTLLADARTKCWEGVDKTLMEKIAPWVPYLWVNNVFIVGPKVTKWEYDQFSDSTSYSQVAVKH
jgi:peptide/nickel transport system substrate-binding protein